MKRTLLLTFFCSFLAIANVGAQGHGFPYGEITQRDISMKTYDKDSSAAAVVLRESGEAFIDLNTLDKVVFDYHVVIKVLKKDIIK